MPVPRRSLIFGLGATGVALAATGLWRTTMASASPRFVTAALGDDARRIAAGAVPPLDLSRLHDDDLVPIDQPVRFAYRGEHGFEPPATRFLSLTMEAAVLTEIEFAPQGEYLPQAAVVTLFEQVLSQAGAAGWQPAADQSRITGPEEFAVLAADRAQPVATAWHLARLQAGGVTLLFRLRRLHPDAFLLNLRFTDEALADRARAVLLRLRAEDGAPADQTRPIDARYLDRAAALFSR